MSHIIRLKINKKIRESCLSISEKTGIRASMGSVLMDCIEKIADMSPLVIFPRQIVFNDNVTVYATDHQYAKYRQVRQNLTLNAIALLLYDIICKKETFDKVLVESYKLRTISGSHPERWKSGVMHNNMLSNEEKMFLVKLNKEEAEALMDNRDLLKIAIKESKKEV